MIAILTWIKDPCPNPGIPLLLKIESIDVSNPWIKHVRTVLYTCFLNHLVTCNQHKLAELRFLTHDKVAFKTAVNQVMCYILHHFDSLNVGGGSQPIWSNLDQFILIEEAYIQSIENDKFEISWIWECKLTSDLNVINVWGTLMQEARATYLMYWGPWTVNPLLDCPYLLTVVQHPQKLLYTCKLTPIRSM